MLVYLLLRIVMEKNQVKCVEIFVKYYKNIRASHFRKRNRFFTVTRLREGFERVQFVYMSQRWSAWYLMALPS